MSIITLLRHGNASPKVEGQADGSRPLSHLGGHQSVVRRAQMGNPQYDLVISSTSYRAKHTAQLVAGGRKPDILLDELAPQSDGSALDQKVHEMFLEHGYAPARTWLEDSRSSALCWKASACLARVLEEIEKHGNPEQVLVGSHSIFVVKMAALLCIGLPHAEVFLDLDIAEASAIVIGHDRELIALHNDPITLPVEAHT